MLIFASREDPSLVCQEMILSVDGPFDLQVRAGIAPPGDHGARLRLLRDTPGQAKVHCDAGLLWASAGALGRSGLAYVTVLLSASQPGTSELDVAGVDFASGRRLGL